MINTTKLTPRIYLHGDPALLSAARGDLLYRTFTDDQGSWVVVEQFGDDWQEITRLNVSPRPSPSTDDLAEKIEDLQRSIGRIKEALASFQIMLDGRMREATDSRTEFMKSTIAMRLQMRKEFMEILQAAGIEVPQGILEKYREQ